MLFQSPSLLAVSAIAFLSLASTSVAGPAHPLHVRHVKAANRAALSQRQAAGCGDVSVSDVQLLRQETAAFRGWFQTWLSANPNDSPASITELKQEYQAFDDFLCSWFNATIDKTAPVPSTLPSNIPIGQGEGQPPYPTTGAAGFPSFPTGPTGSKGGVFAPISTGGDFFPSGIPSSVAPKVGPTAPVSPKVGPTAPVSPKVGPTAPASPSKGGKFNPDAKDNVVVYYGQSKATQGTTLGDMCSNKAVDIVILSFLNKFSDAKGFPTVNFGAACGGSQTQDMKDAGAAGLLSCPELEKDIISCQAAGKKVMLSLGGAEAESAFTDDAEATKFATTLWDLFGAGTGAKAGLRPFGKAVIDGFDIDNENKKPDHYTTFVNALRKAYSGDASRQYFISGAPQCIRPDASIPIDAMLAMDFVFVQFYNNLPCNWGSAGFADSVSKWSADLATKGSKAKLYVGALACPGEDCGGSGYLEADKMTAAVKGVVGQKIPNLGGVSLWDGAEAKVNSDYAGVVKSALA